MCQSANFDLSLHYPIADQGTEEIWINENNGPYLYYTGAGSRLVPSHQYFMSSMDWSYGLQAKINSYIFILFKGGEDLSAL